MKILANPDHVRTFGWLKWGPICTNEGEKKILYIYSQAKHCKFLKKNTKLWAAYFQQRKYYLPITKQWSCHCLTAANDGGELKNRASPFLLWMLGKRGMMILLYHSPCKSCMNKTKNMIVSSCFIINLNLNKMG